MPNLLLLSHVSLIFSLTHSLSFYLSFRLSICLFGPSCQLRLRTSPHHSLSKTPWTLCTKYFPCALFFNYYCSFSFSSSFEGRKYNFTRYLHTFTVQDVLGCYLFGLFFSCFFFWVLLKEKKGKKKTKLKKNVFGGSYFILWLLATESAYAYTPT